MQKCHARHLFILYNHELRSNTAFSHQYRLFTFDLPALCLQAHNFVWKDLTSEHLDALRTPRSRSLPPRHLLAKLMGIRNPNEPKDAILLDFYVHTLQFGQVCELLTGCFMI